MIYKAAGVQEAIELLENTTVDAICSDYGMRDGTGLELFQKLRLRDVKIPFMIMVAKLHSSGILNNAEYAAQSGELSRKVSALRSERRRILMEDEDDEIIESLKSMDSVLAEYTPTAAFDEELFGQIVESVTVVSGTTLRFCLAGGLALTENL